LSTTTHPFVTSITPENVRQFAGCKVSYYGYTGAVLLGYSHSGRHAILGLDRGGFRQLDLAKGDLLFTEARPWLYSNNVTYAAYEDLSLLQESSFDEPASTPKQESTLTEAERALVDIINVNNVTGWRDLKDGVGLSESRCKDIWNLYVRLQVRVSGRRST
jgi:hypothetical protein